MQSCLQGCVACNVLSRPYCVPGIEGDKGGVFLVKAWSGAKWKSSRGRGSSAPMEPPPECHCCASNKMIVRGDGPSIEWSSMAD